MSAVVRLDDYRPKRREPDAMDILLGQFEFLALCNIAVLYGLMAACRLTAARAPAHPGKE